MPAFLLANWRLIALLVALAAAWVYVGTIQHQRDAARKDAAECRVANEQLVAKLEAQNRAVQELADESKRKTEAVAKSLAAARAASRNAATEAERLRAMAGKATGKPSACPAGDAVAQIRKGLR